MSPEVSSFTTAAFLMTDAPAHGSAYSQHNSRAGNVLKFGGERTENVKIKSDGAKKAAIAGRFHGGRDVIYGFVERDIELVGLKFMEKVLGSTRVGRP